MPTGRIYKTNEIRAALDATHGKMSAAAVILGCHSDTIQRRVAKSRELQALIQHYKELRLDTAITKLEDAIIAGQPWAVKFELMYRGRSRGYISSQEITGADGTPLNRVPGPDVGSMTDEQFRAYLAGLGEAASRIAG